MGGVDIVNQLMTNAEHCICRHRLNLSVARYYISLYFEDESPFNLTAFDTNLICVSSDIATSENSFVVIIRSDSSVEELTSFSNGQVRTEIGKATLFINGKYNQSVLLSFNSVTNKGYVIVKEWNECTLRYLPYNLFTLYSMMFEPHGCYPLHAAVVGSGDSGILIGGRSGCGKTTLALSALCNGMDYLAEDKILFDGREHVAYPVSSTFHATDDTCRMLPELFKKVRDKRGGWYGKNCYSLAPLKEQFRCSFTIKAIVLLELSPEVTSRIIKKDDAKAISTIVFSGASIFGHRTDSRYLLNSLKALSGLPSFSFSVSHDIYSNVRALRDLL